MAKFKPEWCYFKLKVTSHDSEKDNEIQVDKVTWLQMLNTALKRSHGVFGEAIEYELLYVDNLDTIAKVSVNDTDILTTAISTYIASDELVGTSLIINVLEQSNNLSGLTVHEDDRIWFKKLVESEAEIEAESKEKERL